MTFTKLGLSDKVLQAVKAAGYLSPTPVQTKSIPIVLARRDLLGISQTGTGKTASFTLPMLTLLERGRARARMPRTLILEPTRELAAQVENSFATYGINHRLTVALLIGGVSFADQNKKLDRGADVLIATPGRLLDHFERGKLLLNGVEILVIDEADRMLDMGFIPDVERICKLIPFTRQTLFFSATMPPEIQHLVNNFLQNPERVEVAPASIAAATVDQKFVRSGSKPFEKRHTLRYLIDSARDLQNAIVFCNRKRDVGVVHRSLSKHGFDASALHGDLDQHQRTQTLEAFRQGEVTIMVASDVAARGLDIPNVSHIFNYDVPVHAEAYVHRIGRTGRAGRAGSAVTIVASSDEKSLAAIEALTKTQCIWIDNPFRSLPTDLVDNDGRSAQKKTGAKSRQGKKTTKSKSRAPASNVASRKTGNKSRRGQTEERSQGRSAKPGKAEKDRSYEKRKNDNQNHNDDKPVRITDGHVPEFLLRPVRS